MFKRKKGRYSEKKVNKERKVISYARLSRGSSCLPL